MEKLVAKFLTKLSLFKTHHGGIKEVIDNPNPTDQYVVIDQLPSKDKATYCINTPEGWLVFIKPYCEDNLVYPSVYGILFRKLDIDILASASLHGMPIDDIYKICEDMKWN